MYGLNIHLKSFKLNPKLASGNDKIRVSITTLPEKNKEAFVTEARQMNFVHHFFTVNITEETERIIFVFRKVGFFDDPIIASTIIHCNELPTRNRKNEEMKTIQIYEPIQNDNNNNNNNNNHKNNKDRRIFGEMEIQFSLTTAFPTFKSKDKLNNNKNNNNKQMKTFQGYQKNNSYSKMNYENQNGYNSIFNDDYC
ncbi:hypothetical protein M9Y10_030511 [Tritrichomonas musculus]|uniref:Uncharacterized protein n=1 Tax=Tritrichomonas musculus TaxID=1915356 RepID=A0ABR2H3C3_9EUKA